MKVDGHKPLSERQAFVCVYGEKKGSGVILLLQLLAVWLVLSNIGFHILNIGCSASVATYCLCRSQ